MAQVDPNAVATACILALQDAIARLDALKQHPDADAGQVDIQIDALQAAQAALRDHTLGAIESSEPNQQAIAAMNAAAADLKTEAAAMQATAAGLAGVAKVVTAATSLVATLARFA